MSIEVRYFGRCDYCGKLHNETFNDAFGDFLNSDDLYNYIKEYSAWIAVEFEQVILCPDCVINFVKYILKDDNFTKKTETNLREFLNKNKETGGKYAI